MSIKEKIRQMVEHRRMEAMKKQLSHKVITIARNMGQNIVSTNYQPAPTPLHPDILEDKEGEILSLDDFDDWREYDMGFYFDALKYGYNLCILCFAYDRKITEVRVTYNGYTVFAESEGRLRAYAPFPIWENAIDMIFERASIKDKKRQLDEREDRKEVKERKISAAVHMLKMLWGY